MDETNKIKTNKAEDTAKEIKNKNKIKTRKVRKWLVTLFIIITLIVSYVTFRGEYLETLELGENYLSVFWQNITYKLSTFGVNFIVLFLSIYLTNKRIKNGLKPFFDEEKKQMPKILNKSIAFVLAIAISFITTNLITQKLMLFINSTAFEIADPVLGYDIGYLVFEQPFINFVIQYALFLVIGLTIYMAFYYIVVFNKYFDGINRETLKKSSLIKQICTNIVIIALLISSFIFIETQNIGTQRFINLNENSNSNYALYGAGMSEVTIKLWGYRILSVVILISVIIAERAFKKGNTKKVIISLSAVPIYLVAMFVVLIGFDLIFVNTNELDKQQAYIKANINNTKQAYNIDIDEVNLGENETITTEILAENSSVVDNIAMIDKNTVLKNLNTLQTNKGYYTYRTTQIASYNVDGKQSLVYISPREISSKRNI